MKIRDSCIKCKGKLVANGDKCTKCEINFCQECVLDSFPTQCFICEVGYQKSVSTRNCFKCNVEKCSYCEDYESDICENCIDNYYVNNSLYVEHSKVNHCDSYCTNSDYCTYCELSYIYRNEVCADCPNNCDYCQQTYTIICSQRKDGYILTPELTCVSFPDNCKCKYSYTLENGLCYTYFKITDFNGEYIGCYTFTFDLQNELYIPEYYEPENGMCKNIPLNKNNC
ncbi:hypothetical protein QTN25_006299 [Entamoeba marina]